MFTHSKMLETTLMCPDLLCFCSSCCVTSIWMCLKMLCTRLYPVWFCWSLSLWKMAISLGILTQDFQTNINICGEHSHRISVWKVDVLQLKAYQSPHRKNVEKWRFIHCFIVQLMVVIHHPQLDMGYKRIWRRIGTTLEPTLLQWLEHFGNAVSCGSSSRCHKVFSDNPSNKPGARKLWTLSYKL